MMRALTVAVVAVAALSLQACAFVEPKGWQPGRTADGCVAEDACGVWPPFYSTASYCGEPHVRCPEHLR